MRIIFDEVADGEDKAAVSRIQHEVFEREMGIRLVPPGVPNNGNVSHLLARVWPSRAPIGTLSVTDTSGDHQLYESCGLRFGTHARIARYTHLAVLRPYRGMNIPLMMMLEAHRRLIVPRRFQYTWLLFNAERASTSFLTRLLGFTPTANTFFSEYGRRCPLVRDERASHSREIIRQAEQYLEQFLHLFSSTQSLSPSLQAIGAY